jgi:hypothetical protein
MAIEERKRDKISLKRSSRPRVSELSSSIVLIRRAAIRSVDFTRFAVVDHPIALAPLQFAIIKPHVIKFTHDEGRILGDFCLVSKLR